MANVLGHVCRFHDHRILLGIHRVLVSGILANEGTCLKKVKNFLPITKI